MKKLNKKGFTLTEMIVVIAIIGILAGVLIPTITGYIKKANRSNDEQLAASMTDEIERYCIEYNVSQRDLLGTDIKTILTFKDYNLEPSRKDWTYVYNADEKKVQVIDVDDITVNASYTPTAVDPTNYDEDLFLIGEGKNDFEQAVKSLCNLKDVANYETIKNNADSFKGLVENFNPTDTLFVSNSTCFSNGTNINKIVYLTNTIHLPEASGYTFNPSAKEYKSAIIKTCDQNSEFKKVFTRLSYIKDDQLKEIKFVLSEDGSPSITFDSLVEEADDITIGDEILKVEKVTVITNDGTVEKIQTTRKFVVTYYNESGVFARGVIYYGTIQDIIIS